MAASRRADPLQRVRELCLALPETNERMTHGAAGFFIRDKKLFVTVADHHHHIDHLALWCAAAPGAQEELLAEEPARFFRPPYVGHRGWLGVVLDEIDGVGPDWRELGEIVRDAYRQVAPKTLGARLGS